MQPSPRQSLGISKGWENNYFLEFAPNVGKLGGIGRDTLAERPSSGFATKEAMLKDFWDQLGMDEYDKNLMEKVPETVEDFAPTVWEVRERLRTIVKEHEKASEDKFSSSKYHILTKGEIDPKLRTLRERKMERKRYIKNKTIQEVQEIKDKLKEINKEKEHQKRQDSSNPATFAKMSKERKQVSDAFLKTRSGFHKKAASGRR